MGEIDSRSIEIDRSITIDSGQSPDRCERSTVHW
jgi:hypothetical protein